MAPISRLFSIAALAVLVGAASLDNAALARRDHHAEIAKRQSELAQRNSSLEGVTRLKKRCPNKAKPSSSSTTVSHSSSHASSTSHSHSMSSSTHHTTSPPSPTHKSSSSSPPKSTSSTKKAEPTQKKEPAPAPKPSPAPPPKPAPPLNGSKKVGLAWPGIDGFSSSAQKQWLGGKVGGFYNWGPTKPNSLDALGIPFFPTIWGDKNVDVWLSTLVKGYAKVAVGANEVNQQGQAQMSVSHGISMWQTQMEPLIARGYTLAGHSISNAQSGLTWLQQFKEGCSSCWNSMTYLNLHFYGTNSQDFINYVTQTRDALGGDKDVIITEVACENFGGGAQCSMAQTEQFLEEITAWMDKTSWVKMYFWFGMFSPLTGVNPDNGLLNSNGTPNSLGLKYIGE